MFYLCLKLSIINYQLSIIFFTLNLRAQTSGPPDVGANDFTISKVDSDQKLCSGGKVQFEISHASWDSRSNSCIEWYVGYIPVTGIEQLFKVPVELLWKKNVKTKTKGNGYVTNCNTIDNYGLAGDPSQKYSPVEITIPSNAKSIKIGVRIFKPGFASSDNQDVSYASFDVDGVQENLGPIIGNGVYDCSLPDFRTTPRSFSVDESRIIKPTNVYVWTAPVGWSFVNDNGVVLNTNTVFNVIRPKTVKIIPNNGSLLPKSGNLEFYAISAECNTKSLVSSLPISYNQPSSNVITQTTPSDIYAYSANIGVILGSEPVCGESGYVYKWEKSENLGTTWTEVGTTKNYNPNTITKTTFYRRWVNTSTSPSNVVYFYIRGSTCSRELSKTPSISVSNLKVNGSCSTPVMRVNCNTDFNNFQTNYSWFLTRTYAQNGRIENETVLTTTPYIDIDYSNPANIGVSQVRASLVVNFPCGSSRSTQSVTTTMPTDVAPVAFGPCGQSSLGDIIAGRSYCFATVPSNQNYNFTITPTKTGGGAIGSALTSASTNTNYVFVSAGNGLSEGFTLTATNPRIPAGCPNSYSVTYNIISDQTVSTGGYMFDLYSTGMPYRGKSYIRVPSANDPNVNFGTDRFNFGTNNFTMEAWVQGKTNSYNLAEYTIFSNWTNTLQAG
ncbi:MAG: hypothetical protein EAZ06_12095, partial [Cytophagales bacterium]